MFQISELSHRTGVPCKTIRFYEEIGLLPPAKRAPNGYREYCDADVERLSFIRRVHMLDLGLDEIAEIVAFRERGEPPCRIVINLMGCRIDDIQYRIRDLERVRDELKAMCEDAQGLAQRPENAVLRLSAQ
jgi:DNA-binding transcriptional MerR regulator